MKKIVIVLMIITVFSLSLCGVVDKLANKNPVITSVTANPPQISTQDTTRLKVVAEDPDGDILSFRWECSKGNLLTNSGEEVQWVAPNEAGTYGIDVKVTDENGGDATDGVNIIVVGDESPIVMIINPVEGQILTGLGKYPIEAEVSYRFPDFIDYVDFWLNSDSLLGRDSSVPYRFSDWNLTFLAGAQTIFARAFLKNNPTNFGEDSVHVFVEGVVPVPKK